VLDPQLKSRGQQCSRGSSRLMPSAAEADEGAVEQESLEGSVNDRRVNELWMDFDVLCKCFRSDM